jgi:type IV pilus assembly protein PilP
MMRVASMLFFGLFMLSGCEMLGLGDGDGGDGQKVGKAMAKAKANLKEAVQGERPTSRLDRAIASQADYVYNPIGKRDPFRAFLAGGGRGGGDDETPRTPLQRYEIDEYRLVGIIWGIDRPRALVEDPDHVGHVMEIGTYIGKNWGKVTQITSSEVVVTEEYQTMDGELVVNPIRLSLPVGRDVLK